MGELVVFGATGAVGRRIAELAAAGGERPILAGRRADALAAVARPHGLETRVVPDLSPDALAAAFDGADAVISCAGPYTHLGPPVLDAVITAGAHYVDCTGEPRWVETVGEDFEPRALAAGVSLAPSLGLGLAIDLAAQTAADGIEPVERLALALRIKGMRPSLASLRSTVELIAGGAPVRHAGATTWELAGRRMRRFPTGLGAQFPTPDALALSRAWPDARIETYLQSPAPPLTAAALAGCGLAWRVPPLLGATRAVLSRAATRRLSDHAGGGASKVTATATGLGGSRSATAEVDDIYDITARGALAVVNGMRGEYARPGLWNAGAFVGPPAAAAARLGVRLRTL